MQTIVFRVQVGVPENKLTVTSINQVVECSGALKVLYNSKVWYMASIKCIDSENEYKVTKFGST